MQFDSQGLPRDNGATDNMDSCRLAGLMACFGHLQAPDMRKYLIDGEGVRHPTEFPANNPKNFTRDQLVCLVAGLHAQLRFAEAEVLLEAARARWYRAQNTEADVPGSVKKFPNGADLLSPSVMNHLRLCAGQKSFLLGRLWLILDICFYAWFAATTEPNQLMTMCSVAGPFYVNLFKKLDPLLPNSITGYWSGWRNENVFAQFLISKF